jgi:hypothetical protein
MLAFHQSSQMMPPGRNISVPNATPTPHAINDMNTLMPRNSSALASGQSSTALPTLNEPITTTTMLNPDMTTFINDDVQAAYGGLDLTGTGVIGADIDYDLRPIQYDPNAVPSEDVSSSFFDDQLFGGQGQYMNRDEL